MKQTDLQRKRERAPISKLEAGKKRKEQGREKERGKERAVEREKRM